MDLTPEIKERLEQLEKKYSETGQDLVSYMDGLLYQDYLRYWEYINLDVLLSLQQPRTSFPDEKIFILYHQITELYFRLMLHAMEQVAKQEELNAALLKKQLRRLISYVDNLINSFEIMIDGMEPDEFMKFRMALLPASGFQSGQFRMVETASTDFINLVHPQDRAKLSENSSFEDILEHHYWKKGATELATGKKTLTLTQFEEKYDQTFLQMAKDYKDKNLYAAYRSLSENERNDEELIELMRTYDLKMRVHWPLMHYKSAARYLQKDQEDIKATGGTNWQQYLPPKNQRIIFFPGLWTEEEIDKWGKKYIEDIMHSS
ncbi:MAG: tryptophan 2,3-dioxygenase [Bacteroidetes bacterium SW_11_45_7]|nr:MAG: tryptophan 2,3-dioxygenase [Bacteroidetes bacterium SW_11_45_7]